MLYNAIMASVSCYLFGSFTFNELLVNTVGLGRQLFVRRVMPEILAGRPKLNVLFAELRLQEDTKGSFPICGEEGEEEGERGAELLKTRPATQAEGHIHPLFAH